MVRPRLLFLGHTLPYPPDRGAALRDYHVLRSLAERYDIDALVFRRRDDPTQMPLDDRVRHLRELGDVEVFPAPGGAGGIRHVLHRLKRWLSDDGGLPRGLEDRAYRRTVLEKVFERDPRIVHVASLDLHPYLPQLVGRTVVLTHDTREYRPGGAQGPRVGAEPTGGHAGWEAVEREWLPRMAATLVPFEAQRGELLDRVPDARVETVPPAVDTRHFTATSGRGHGLAYVGGTRGTGSREALEYFTERILPRLRSVSGVQALDPISWIGPTREGDRERYRARGIDITGYVEDIRPLVRPAACFIMPRRAPGGATRILQAWAMGKAAVSTSVGCAGIDAVDGENILIRDDAEAFARAVVDVLQDRGLRERLGSAARRTVEERYSWDRRGRELVAFYETLEGTAQLDAGERD